MAEIDEKNTEISETQQMLWNKQETILQELEGLTFSQAMYVLENVQREMKHFVLQKP